MKHFVNTFSPPLPPEASISDSLKLCIFFLPYFDTTHHKPLVSIYRRHSLEVSSRGVLEALVLFRSTWTASEGIAL